MARPREFDEAAALDAALAVFWAKGYDGTSIDDLVTATGVGRASLYGAFGDKERLFSRVADHYLAKVGELEAVDPDASPRAALTALVDRWVEGVCTGPRGCFVQQSSGVESTAPLVRDLVERTNQARQTTLAKLIQRGQKAGELTTATSALDLARYLMIVQQGLAAAARSGTPPKELRASARVALERVFAS